MPSRKGSLTAPNFFVLKRTKSFEESVDDKDSRRRITLACVRCRHRKIRCDGAERCSKCIAAKQPCEYIPVTKEENLAAREKKAISKLNRGKVLKITTEPVAKAIAFTKRKRSAVRVDHDQSESSATPEPLHFDIKHAFGGGVGKSQSTYSLPSPAALAQSSTFGYSVPSLHGQHYGYYSSASSIYSEQESDYVSTDASLPSTPKYANYEDPTSGYFSSPSFTNPFAASVPNVSAQTGSSSTTSSPVHPHLARSYSSPYFHHQSSVEQQNTLPQPHPYHAQYQTYSQPSTPSGLSFPSFSSQPPAGLCLYLPGPGESSSASPAHSSYTPSSSYAAARSQPVSPVRATPPILVRSPTFPVAPPTVYSGPIDWSRRPLAPFPSVLTPVTPAYQDGMPASAGSVSRPPSVEASSPVHTMPGSAPTSAAASPVSSGPSPHYEYVDASSVAYGMQTVSLDQICNTSA